MTSVTAAKPHSLLKRLFSASRLPPPAVADKITNSIGIADLKEKEKNLPLVEPSSVCLEKMVQNFLEESNEKPPRCGRRRCSCFNGNRDDSSDDDDDEDYDYDDVDNFYVDATNHRIPVPLLSSEIIKSLVPCATTAERNLLAVAARIVAGNNNKKIKTGRVEIDVQRKILVSELSILEWDAAICISHWETTPAFPPGKSISNRYEYVDVMIEGGERVVIGIDFKSEFEIPRSTKNYRRLLEMVPTIFVGSSDRLLQIVAVMSEAAKKSMKKEGLHIPPWRKPEYMRSKWVSPHQRLTPFKEQAVAVAVAVSSDEDDNVGLDQRLMKSGEPKQMWQPPAIQPKKPPASRRGETKIITGLGFIV